MRAFIAIEVGEPVRARLKDELTRLRKLAPDARWVKPERLHLTLSFLGETADAGVPAVGEAMARVASKHRPFSLRAAGHGTFGPLESPKVLWVGLGGGLEALSSLQRELSAELSALGHVPDFEVFEPHLTLARSKNPRGDAALDRCARALGDAQLGELAVREVVLFKSLAVHDGLHPEAIARHALAPVAGPDAGDEGRACPCGSSLSLSACCAPRHDGARPAETAEALMRSRYSAFALGDGAYILATQAPGLSSETAEAISAWARRVKWLGLTVLRCEQGGPSDSVGVVEFEARFVDAGRPVTQHEVSRFDRPGGRWRYRSS